MPSAKIWLGENYAMYTIFLEAPSLSVRAPIEQLANCYGSAFRAVRKPPSSAIKIQSWLAKLMN